MSTIRQQVVFEKPVVENFSEKEHKAIELFKRSGWLRKEEIAAHIGVKWDANGDRKVRDIVANIALRYPIISSSKTKANHGWRVLSPRMSSMASAS